jgi:hypothetical protein
MVSILPENQILFAYIDHLFVFDIPPFPPAKHMGHLSKIVDVTPRWSTEFHLDDVDDFISISPVIRQYNREKLMGTLQCTILTACNLHVLEIASSAYSVVSHAITEEAGLGTPVIAGSRRSICSTHIRSKALITATLTSSGDVKVGIDSPLSEVESIGDLDFDEFSGRVSMLVCEQYQSIIAIRIITIDIV